MCHILLFYNKICDQCKNVNVTALEIKQIIEGVLRDKDNIPKLRRSINIIICDFMSCNPKSRVGSNEFIAHTMKSKPNTKSKILIELKGIIEEHVAYTNSEKGKEILNNFGEYLPLFKKVMPYDYERMLQTFAEMEAKGLSSEQAQIEAFYANTRQ